MPDKHTSSQFDADLEHLSSRFFEMGGLVESQFNDAMEALSHLDMSLVEKVVDEEDRLNAMEVELDAECSNIVARRQPIASDLRRLMAISKGITNLERAGDEAHKIATRTRKIMDDGGTRNVNVAEIRSSGQMAATLLRDALAAFARLDTVEASRVMREDEAIDEQYRKFVRKLPMYMAENPRIISAALDYLSIASAIERIGDHAKNLAELVIYVVKGKDVRHVARDRLEREALDN